jgi:hypothetical protein
MPLRSRVVRLLAPVLLLLCFDLTAIAADRARGTSAEEPSWGAIASMQAWVGYSFNHPTRIAAETAAQAQCDRAAGRPGTCAVRAFFDRSCGALATGTYGEWGLATASTETAAGKAAAAQCDAHLPAEPCKVIVKVCSPH